jgi:D-arabinose 1-dehydrogenase-like Zn-dependent alcohol dehydrogenase
VKLRVRAAGLNFADLLMIGGTYQEKPALPFSPGLEAAGEVMAVGSGVTRLAPGDRVLALLDHGGFAEQALAREADVYSLPDGLDDATAAGFAIAYGTAHGALRWRADLKPGETVLIHGAGGGVGLAAVEVAKAMGATVIAIPLGNIALGMARLADPDDLPAPRAAAAKHVVAAMTAEPFMVAGSQRFCTVMMSALGRKVAMKTGAEGVYCAALPELGLGVALKDDDGAGRAAEVAMGEVLIRLGVIDEGERARLADALSPPVLNRVGFETGRVQRAAESPF